MSVHKCPNIKYLIKYVQVAVHYINNNISHNMEISISWKCLRLFCFWTLWVTIWSTVFVLLFTTFLIANNVAVASGHVITTATPFCSYSRIPWSLLAGSNTCVDVLEFFFEFKLQNKRNFYYDCYILCLHNRRELRKTISEKTLIFEIKQHENSQITRSHRNSWDIEF